MFKRASQFFVNTRVPGRTVSAPAYFLQMHQPSMIAVKRRGYSVLLLHGGMETSVDMVHVVEII